MSSATAVKIPAGSPGAITVGDPMEPGLRAWRGLLRAHACLTKRLDAELERCHGLPMSSFEVLHHLARADAGRKRLEAARETHLALVREQFISRFSAAELAEMAEILERIAPSDSGC